MQFRNWAGFANEVCFLAPCIILNDAAPVRLIYPVCRNVRDHAQSIEVDSLFVTPFPCVLLALIPQMEEEINSEGKDTVCIIEQGSAAKRRFGKFRYQQSRHVLTEICADYTADFMSHLNDTSLQDLNDKWLVERKQPGASCGEPVMW